MIVRVLHREKHIADLLIERSPKSLELVSIVPHSAELENMEEIAFKVITAIKKLYFSYSPRKKKLEITDETKVEITW